MDLKFSVLMSIYKNDNPKYLEAAISSTVNQSLIPSEIVIVKDGSLTAELEAELEKWVNAYSDIIKVKTLPENLGLAKALNQGLNVCSYEYIARMDSDDVCCPDRFKLQMEYIATHQNVSCLGSWYKQYDESLKQLVSERKVPEEHQSIVRYAQHRTPINHVTIVFKKSAVLAIGGYPEQEGRFEDWWLSLKLIQKGYKLHNLPMYLVDVRGGGDFIKRRGGVEYLLQEIRNMHKLQAEKLISTRAFILNICIRAMVRLVPNVIREYSYRLIRKI